MRNVTRSRPATGRTAAGFLDQESGSVTIFAVIGFAMCMVVIGLVFDVGRVMNIHTQAKSYADRVALAVAAELDGRPGALNDAWRAASGADAQVQPGRRISLSGDTTIDVRQMTFLASLGPDPADADTLSPVPGDVVTATWTPGLGLRAEGLFTLDLADRETRYVIVDTSRETEDFLLLPMLAWLTPATTNSATVSPQAVAGFKQQLCNSAPIMVCNPAEATLGPGAPFDPTIPRMIRARLHGNGNNWGPNTYSLANIVTTANAGAPSEANLRAFLGRIDPNTTCGGDTVRVTKNLNTNTQNRLRGIREGLNVRFDIYSSNRTGPLRNQTQYAPAPTVVKGWRVTSTPGGNSSCNYDTTSSTTRPFPRTGADAAGVNWNRAQYFNDNHGLVSPPAGLAAATRYQVYRAELDPALPPSQVNDGEQGAPRCSNRPPVTDQFRDRRLLTVAVVNCMQNLAQLNSAQNPLVPVEAYAEMFMTEPMGNTTWGAASDELDLEVFGNIRSGLPDDKLREFPVLVR